MEKRFVIDLHDVAQHEGSWTFPLTREWREAVFHGSDVGAGGDDDGRLEVRVTQAGKEFLVQGRLHVALSATCGRCLRPTPVEVEADVAVLFVPGPVVVREPAKEEDDAEPDEGPDVEHYQGQSIVLDDYVRDTILLEVPMNPRCATDCTLPERPQGLS